MAISRWGRTFISLFVLVNLRRGELSLTSNIRRKVSEVFVLWGLLCFLLRCRVLRYESSSCKREWLGSEELEIVYSRDSTKYWASSHFGETTSPSLCWTKSRRHTTQIRKVFQEEVPINRNSRHCSSARRKTIKSSPSLTVNRQVKNDTPETN